MKFFLSLALLALLAACTQTTPETAGVRQPSSPPDDETRRQVAATLDSFNVAAAQADFDRYFDFFTEDAIFMGTDATEHWVKDSFMVWAKPAFDKKRTWNFKAIERHVFFAPDGQLAWFDELLDTEMKICRGSGVLVKRGNDWKIQQYVLSMTIPNDSMGAAIRLKAPVEDELIRKIKAK